MKNNKLLFFLSTILSFYSISINAQFTSVDHVNLSGTVYPVLLNSVDEPQTWKYILPSETAPSHTWMNTGFDDSAWNEGLGVFATPWVGINPKNTIIQEPGGNLFLRKTVTLNNASDEVIENLYAYMAFDDNALVYINGVYAVFSSQWIGGDGFGYFPLTESFIPLQWEFGKRSGSNR
jgi:hypothetical protein